MIEGIALI